MGDILYECEGHLLTNYMAPVSLYELNDLASVCVSLNILTSTDGTQYIHILLAYYMVPISLYELNGLLCRTLDFRTPTNSVRSTCII